MRIWKHLAAFLLAGPVAAEDILAGDLIIGSPIARETAATAMAGAGYLTITNNGDAPERLLAVEADFPRVMIHDTILQDGVATMTHLVHLDIPQGTTASLMPGGKHVMFMGLQGDPFEVGETVPATLVFQKAGRVAVEFVVLSQDDIAALEPES